MAVPISPFPEIVKAPGIYHYATGPDTDAVTLGPGISLIWKDAQGVEWRTSKGPGDQTGSVFRILSTMDEPDPVGNLYVKVQQFNCKLYNGAGQMKTLTEGEFVGLFSKY